MIELKNPQVSLKRIHTISNISLIAYINLLKLWPIEFSFSGRSSTILAAKLNLVNLNLTVRRNI